MKKLLLFYLLLPHSFYALEKPSLSWWQRTYWKIVNKERDLWYALQKKNKEGAILAIQMGANINEPFMGFGKFPVIYAVDNQWPDVVELMIDAGLDLQKSLPVLYGVVKNYVLHEAVKNNWFNLIKRLLDAGIDINSVSQYHFSNVTPLMTADNPKMVQFLLDHGAVVDIKIPNGWTALHWYAASKKDYRDIIKILLAHGADVNAKDNTGRTPLDIVAMNGTPQKAAFLIAHGADINAQTNLGATPLMTAQVHRNEPVYKYLLSLYK